jgi:molybdopterin-guanine dinucleotide biosynthesis protein
MDWACDDRASNIYWLCGMAGTGKTTIAYSLCDRLKAEGHLGASYFCSRTIDESCNIRAIIPSIMYQLASCSATLRSLIVKAVKGDREITSNQTDTQFTHLICDPIQSCPDDARRVLAFDAFNEFKTLEDARLLLLTLTAFAPNLPSVKLFITSQQEPQIEEVFKSVKGTPFYLHNVEESLVRVDIERYLYERRGEIRRVKRLDEKWWTDEQLQHLLDSAGKLFIYASTACSFLDTSDADECKKILK